MNSYPHIIEVVSVKIVEKVASINLPIQFVACLLCFD